MKHLNYIFITFFAILLLISCTSTTKSSVNIKDIDTNKEITIENQIKKADEKAPTVQIIQDITDISNNSIIEDIGIEESLNTAKTTFEYIPIEKIEKDAEEQKTKESQVKPVEIVQEEDKTIIAKSIGEPISYTYDMLTEYNSFLKEEGYDSIPTSDKNSPSNVTTIVTEPLVISEDERIPSYTFGTTTGVLKPISEEINGKKIAEQENENNDFEEIKDTLDNSKIEDVKEKESNNFVIYLITFVICSIITAFTFLIVTRIKKRR